MLYNSTDVKQNYLIDPKLFLKLFSLVSAESPKVLYSKCESQLDVLTCTCTSEGFPLPTIEWSLLENHDEYFVTSGVSSRTINSTVTLTVKEEVSTVYCLSRNEAGKEQKKINVTVTPATTAGQHTHTHTDIPDGMRKLCFKPMICKL